MNAIANRTYSDVVYTYGTDSNGNVITGSYNSSNGIYDILDQVKPIIAIIILLL